MTIDLELIRRTVQLAHESLDLRGFPSAAILTRDGVEIAYGLSSTETTQDITAHGEVQAIRAAGKQAVNPLTMYSTLEPCLMCLAASVWAGVTRIVFGCRRTSVNPAYYVNSVDAKEAARILVSPPELVLLDTYEKDVVALIQQYEER